jgi:hypothetical protein
LARGGLVQTTQKYVPANNAQYLNIDDVRRGLIEVVREASTDPVSAI